MEAQLAIDSRPIAVTMGEPAGIGPDLILQLYAARTELKLPPFLVYGNGDFLASRAQKLGLSFDLGEATPDDAADLFPHRLPVCHIEGLVPDKPGNPTPLSGKVVIEAIALAVRDTLAGNALSVVTAPIHKSVLYASGFTFPGHTEYLASLCGIGGNIPMPVMMLAHDALRVIPATIHVPISEVPRLITADLLVKTGRIVAHDLRTRHGIPSPRLALAGLNPHAGEGGAIGEEDINVVGPAVRQLVDEGLNVVGPLPADTLFHLPLWRSFDAIIAMYHDQALIPIKTLAFEEAVNVTLGLPIIRTSPDHGTALDIAGTGRGSNKSFLAAIRLADRLSRGPAQQEQQG